MENKEVIIALSALAHETRLNVFRQLVQAGPDGLAAGVMSSALEVPPQTLSFHLKELSHAGLVSQRREGRSIIYAPNFDRMAAIVGFLGDNCCGGTEQLKESCCEETTC
jgi:ArsR family transcriptional regulator, arsenate/arsenite/antimonite-responsive transcriptional repressor